MGYRIAVHYPEDVFGLYAVFIRGDYDEALRSISLSDVVLDAGANVGAFAARAARKARRVIAVEPSPENFETLNRTIHLNNLTNVLPIKAGLDDADGIAYLSGHSVWASIASHSEGSDPRPVQTLTVDTLLRKIGESRIDVAKLDIEGSELKVLRSGNWASHPRVIVVEVAERNSMEAQTILAQNGFSVSQLRPSFLSMTTRVLLNVRGVIEAEKLTRGFVPKYLARQFGEIVRLKHDRQRFLPKGQHLLIAVRST